MAYMSWTPWHHGLSINNTFFKNKPYHKVSWRHPRSGHWHQLDLVITRLDSLDNVLYTRSYHSADCDTDHSLIYVPGIECNQNGFFIPSRTSVTLPIPRRINSSLNQSQRRSPELKSKVQKRIGTLFVTSYTTQHSQHTAKATTKTLTLYEANITLMELVIDAKRSAVITFKRDPSQTNLTALRAARNVAQQTARHCANNYWLQLCQSIQTSSDTGHIWDMYDGIKKTTGPAIRGRVVRA